MTTKVFTSAACRFHSFSCKSYALKPKPQTPKSLIMDSNIEGTILLLKVPGLRIWGLGFLASRFSVQDPGSLDFLLII